MYRPLLSVQQCCRKHCCTDNTGLLQNKSRIWGEYTLNYFVDLISFHVGHQHMFQYLKGRIIYHKYKQWSNHATPHYSTRHFPTSAHLLLWVSSLVAEHFSLFGWLDSPVSRAHQDSLASELRSRWRKQKGNRLLEETNSAPFKVA